MEGRALMAKAVKLEYRLDADDVTIENLEPEMCECCDVNRITKVVWIDLRSAGTKVRVGGYCGRCAKDVAEAIREGLPKGAGL